MKKNVIIVLIVIIVLVISLISSIIISYKISKERDNILSDLFGEREELEKLTRDNQLNYEELEESDYEEITDKNLEFEMAVGNNYIPYIDFIDYIHPDSEIKKENIISQVIQLEDPLNGGNKNYILRINNSVSFEENDFLSIRWIIENEKYLRNTGTSIRTDKHGILKLIDHDNLRYIKHDKVYLLKGDNQKVISNSMEGHSFNELLSNCEISNKICSWNGSYGRWDCNVYDFDYVLTDEDIGKVVSIPVKSNCKFS